MSVDCSSRWYVAQTHPHAEIKACQHLGRQGFSYYLPRYLKQRRHARRVDKTVAPLFPRYVFVLIDTTMQRWLAIDSTIGVTKLLRNGEVPAVVPHEIITALKGREDAEGYVQLLQRPRFLPGDRIRVAGGAFCDCLGLYEDVSSHERVAILLDLLGRKVRVIVNTDQIEAA